MKKIVVLSPSFSSDSYLREKLSKLGETKFNDEQIRFNSDSELISFIGEAEIVVTGLENMSISVLSKLPKLKFISKYGVGLNNINLEYCDKKNISIGWKSGVNKFSVAEITLGFCIMLFRNLHIKNFELRKQVWNKNGGNSLYGKKIGIIGLGNIGKKLIDLLAPFNCKIYANDILPISRYCKNRGIQDSTKEYIYNNCDLISLHVPLTKLTENMINKNVFYAMKKSAFVINTSRGGIINEKDLIESLNKNEISGAALDVFVDEPNINKDLLNNNRIILSPHISGNSKEAVRKMGLSAINHIKSYLK